MIQLGSFGGFAKQVKERLEFGCKLLLGREVGTACQPSTQMLSGFFMTICVSRYICVMKISPSLSRYLEIDELIPFPHVLLELT